MKIEIILGMTRRKYPTEMVYWFTLKELHNLRGVSVFDIIPSELNMAASGGENGQPDREWLQKK